MALFWQDVQVDKFDAGCGLLRTVFELPVSLYSTYLHRCFYMTYEVHVLESSDEGYYRVSKKNLMPFQIQISREFYYGTLSIPIGIRRTDRD